MRKTKRVKVKDVKKIKLTGMRSQGDIHEMLREAIERREAWKAYFTENRLTKKENAEALRNYTALRGVVKALQWVLLNPNVEHPLD